MKPNDKAYEAARSAILKAIAERNCIIAGVPFNENNTDDFEAGEAVEHAKVAVDAAYAAQFPPSEDYAELLKMLRSMHKQITSAIEKADPWGITDETVPGKAADALEAVLAERDDSREQLKYFGELHRQEYDRICAERDALLARLAPVDDKALVDIVTNAISKFFNEMPNTLRGGQARVAISAIRPHIEAAERERCAKALEITSDEIRLHAGEMTAQEMRSVLAVLAWKAAAIRSGK